MIRKLATLTASRRAERPPGQPAAPNRPPMPTRPSTSTPRIHPAPTAVRPPGEVARRGSGERKRPLPPATAGTALPLSRLSVGANPIRRLRLRLTSWPWHAPPWPRPPLSPRPMRQRTRLRRSHGAGGGVGGRRPRRNSRVLPGIRMSRKGSPAAGDAGMAGIRLRGTRIHAMTRVRLRGSRMAETRGIPARGRMVAGPMRIGLVDAGVAVVVGATSTGNRLPGAMTPTPRKTTVDADGAVVGAGRMRTAPGVIVQASRMMSVVGGGVGVGGMGPVGSRPDRVRRQVAAPKRRRRISACGC